MCALGEGPRRAVWEEVAAAAAVRWQYADRSAPLDLAREAAQRLHYFEPEVRRGTALSVVCVEGGVVNTSPN